MLVAQQYSIACFQDEVRALVARGSVGRQQRIYELRRYFGNSQWHNVEQLLNLHDYLLKDYVVDLVGHESWAND
jgi:Domain of unknown function (DUF4327)